MRIIIYIVLAMAAFLLNGCVTERIEKRPVYHFAFTPEERGGLHPGRLPPRSQRKTYSRDQYSGRVEPRTGDFIPARLEQFNGNPHLSR